MLMILTVSGWCQSQVNLSNQSKVMDFTGFPSTKPVRTGTALPGTCVTGEMYLKTDAPAGQGLHSCVAGSWSIVGSGGGPSVQFHTVIDLKAEFTATVLSVAAGRCWGGLKPAVTATITAGTGNGSYVVYCTDSQTIVVEHSASAGLTVACNNCVSIGVTTPAVPDGMYAIASGTITAGNWASVTDLREFSMRMRNVNGAGMNVSCNGGVCVHQVDSAVVQIKSDAYTPVGTFDASAATVTKPARTGTALPGTCAVGDQFFKTDAAAGQNLFGCTATNVWTVLGAPAIATHTELIATGSCGNSDDLPRPDPSRWWEPKSGMAAATASCSVSGSGQVKTMSRVFGSATSELIYLVTPLLQNRTGNMDLSLHGFATVGSGVLRMEVGKACLTSGLPSDLSYSITDIQTMQWTATDTQTGTQSLTGLTVPAGCTGQGLLLRLRRDVSVGGNSTGEYHLQSATIVARSN